MSARHLAALETIRQRLCACATPRDGGAAQASASKPEQLLDSLGEDGLWKDVVYRSDELKNWPAAMHLARLFTMTQAWFGEDSPDRADPRLLAGILRGLDGWYAANPQSANWWWNQIGAPMTLGEVLVHIKGACDGAYIERAIPAFTCHEPALRFTGQNMVWVAGVQVRHGVLTDNPGLVTQGFQLIGRELHVFPDEEGIQPDMSFHQHGKVLYSGGYGQGFAGDVARFAWLAHGTPYAWPDHTLRLFCRYLLDGSRWMVRGRTFDYGAIGREITRAGHSAQRFFDGIRSMALLETPRQAEFAETDTHAMQPGVSYVTGNRYFWYSDLMTQHRPDYYVSVRLTSNRIENADWACCGGEGRFCHHMAEGATFLMRDGDEYRDLFPTWNWRQIPGTTVEQTSGDFNPDALRGYGERAFAGGVSDGAVGCAGMDFRRGTLTAKKAWFLFEDGLVALGADIASGGEAPVVTTLNQCRHRGEARFLTDRGTETLADGTHPLAPGAAFWHDGFSYHILDGKGRLDLGTQSGSWAGCGVGSATEETHAVLNARLDHGARPGGATYAYAILATPQAPERTPDAARFAVVANTPALQAVWDARAGRGHAVLYAPGSVTFPDGQTLAADRACLLLYDPDAQGQATLTLAEGERKAGLLTLTLTGRLAARVAVALPERDRAGASQTLVLG